MMSDRASQGLRGPVKCCTEESTFRHMKETEIRSEHTTEYDSDGRITLSRSRNPDGSYWATRYEYATSGQLLKTASGIEGNAPARETRYSYDQQGRLQRITKDGGTESPVSFHYDEHGQKTKIAVSRAEDYRPDTATAGESPFEAAGRAPNLPGGGSATTIHDEQDRPTEVQIRDASGELVSHAFRIYDAEGRVLEEKQTLDNLVSMFPSDVRAKMLDQSGLSPDQLRQQLGRQLTNLMAGQSETNSVVYRYDAAGHLIHTSRRIFNWEDEIESTYNEQGDVASETRSMRFAGDNESYSELQHSYEYDEHGNWTAKTTSYRSSSDAAFQSTTVNKRSLTYY